MTSLGLRLFLSCCLVGGSVALAAKPAHSDARALLTEAFKKQLPLFSQKSVSVSTHCFTPMETVPQQIAEFPDPTKWNPENSGHVLYQWAGDQCRIDDSNNTEPLGSTIITPDAVYASYRRDCMWIWRPEDYRFPSVSLARQWDTTLFSNLWSVSWDFLAKPFGGHHRIWQRTALHDELLSVLRAPEKILSDVEALGFEDVRGEPCLKFKITQEAVPGPPSKKPAPEGRLQEYEVWLSKSKLCPVRWKRFGQDGALLSDLEVFDFQTLDLPQGTVTIAKKFSFRLDHHSSIGFHMSDQVWFVEVQQVVLDPPQLNDPGFFAPRFDKVTTIEDHTREESLLIRKNPTNLDR